ncbi:McrB family protein [uncultured Tessaracoccus sp.]|uniref:McrB family protein n=1 Tax=uncultured Tessaracoccus sp. TaxID=905023 RepID=UPI002603F225|nr:AAA family ATPase [uncultured Tessaracoccus sp.]
MSELSAETSLGPVRRFLLYPALLEVLSEAGSPIPRAEAVERVEEKLSQQLNHYELEPLESNGLPRWVVNLDSGSTDLAAAGWITKLREGWKITEPGLRALAELDGEELVSESGRLYPEKRKKSSGPMERRGQLLDAALDLLEPGTWTSYSELAALVNTNPQTVGAHMGATEAEGAHRVLGKNGLPVPDFRWNDAREETQQEVLEEEGVDFSEGSASPKQMLRMADFRDFLEDKGILPALPKRAWLVRGSAVDGHDLVPRWRADGFISLRAAKLRHIEPGIARDELRPIVEEDYAHASYAGRAAKLDEFHAFLSRMRVGDIVATTSQGQLYLGEIASDAEFVSTDAGLANLRRLTVWDAEGIDYADLASSIKAKLQVQLDVVDLTQSLELLEEMREAVEEAEVRVEKPKPVVERHATLADATDALAEQLHVDKSWLQDIIDLLKDRPQVIFYGPPGTGKTFIARELAEHLAGDNVRLVQFHPGYSYEDFFEGFRPQPDGSFALKPGPLRKTVEAARENETTPYFLIIDEINRGNIAKIFGELYFLLEYRDQAIELLYGDDETGFTLPKNVFIIGTMNTADRSIALVDAAMRRRFSFVSLHPSEPPTSGVLRRWLAAKRHDQSIADLLDELNNRIKDPEFKIGPSYFMRDAVHRQGGLERTWRSSILPLLEEHHFGDGVDVEAQYGLADIQASVASKPGDTGAATDPS